MSDMARVELSRKDNYPGGGFFFGCALRLVDQYVGTRGGKEEAERRRGKKFVDLRSNPVFGPLSRVGPQERGRKLLGEASEK